MNHTNRTDEYTPVKNIEEQKQSSLKSNNRNNCNINGEYSSLGK